jgi:hypothetical protein
MSHKKLRQEKNCLNCGHTVEDRFCTQCGQENLELNDSTLHLIIHYVQDLFHYDGKLWHTMKSLVTRPGLVAKEYLEGKRQRCLEPIRFYVFASTVFFLMFFLYVEDDSDSTSVTPAANYSKRLYNLNQEKTFLQGTVDTVHANALISSVQRMAGGQHISEDTVSSLRDSINVLLEARLTDTLAETEEQMSWLETFVEKRFQSWSEEVNEKYEGDENKANSVIGEKVLHSLPQLFFLSLPFFAFFLKILYGSSKRKLFVEHFVFSIYHYAYLFFVMFLFYLVLIVGKMIDSTLAEVLEEWITLIVVFYPLIYLLLSMRRFYEDRWLVLSLKFTALSMLLVATMIVLFILILIIAFLF